MWTGFGRTGFGSMLAGAVAATAAATGACAQTLPAAPLTEGTLLDVTAVGRVVRTPDLATVRAGVVTQSPTAAAALTENARRMAQVVKSLKGAGIADRDIATSNVSLQPQYRYADGKPPAITGYQASNSASVRFREIAKSGAALDALVLAGANQIDGPSMSLSDPDGALNEARADAVRRARERAALYAGAAGLKVERIVSITENGEDAGGAPPPPMPYRMRAMSVADAAPETAVMPGETDVTATVAVKFLLK